MEVDHHGVHKSLDGLWWLLEKTGVDNARGLDIRCPIKVHAVRGGLVGHALLPDIGSRGSFDAQLFGAMKEDTLLSSLLPVPNQQFSFIPQTRERVLKLFKLQRLCGGLSIGTSASYLTKAQAKSAALGSNLLPYIIYDADVRWMANNDAMLSMFLGGYRSLIILGKEDIVLPFWVDRASPVALDNLVIPDVDLRQQGAQILRAWMREEISV